jgi:Ni,Fe-hydrogenase maturation factor
VKYIENLEPGTENQTVALGFRRPVTLSPCHLVTLVIGYGNDLRGDDAVGPLAATAVAAWNVAGVSALAVHQLTPELAEALAAADLAIFVDARAPALPSPSPSPHLGGMGESSPPPGDGGEGAEIVEVHLIEPAAVDSAIGHTGDPRVLLALAEALYGRRPAAWSITVPARSFAFGASLSPAAERGLAAALQHMSDLLANATCAINQSQRSQRTTPCTRLD